MSIPIPEMLESACGDCVFFEKCMIRDSVEFNVKTETAKKFRDYTSKKNVCPLFAPRQEQKWSQSFFVERCLKEIEKWSETHTQEEASVPEAEFNKQTMKFKALREVVKAYSLEDQSVMVNKVQSLLMQVYGGIKNGSVSK